MSKKVIIRKATPQDVRGIIACLNGSKQLYNKYKLRIKYEWLARRVAYVINSNKLSNFFKDDFDDGFFVALYNGELVGYIEIVISVPPIVWRINSLHVLDKCRKKGIGRKLIDTAIKYAEERGSKRVDVYVTDDAIKFYNAVGFNTVKKMYSLVYTLENGFEY